MSRSSTNTSKKKKSPPASPCCGGKSCGQNGKGDSPRNVSSKFKNNYDSINWSEDSKKKS